MNFEDLLELLKPRPSFWLRVWIFLFLLINRKEGMRLMETLEAKMDEFIQKTDEMNRRVQAYSEDADRKLKESLERI
jgi:hypothetical protein